MEPRHPQVVDSVLDVYRRYWVLLLQAAKPGWEQLDVTAAQLKCLVVLEARGALPIGRVGDVLGMSRPSTSVLINQLVQLGLVARIEDPQDRRRTNVSLTSDGRSFIQRLHRGEEEFMRGCFERLDKGALIALSTGLAALAQVMSGAEGSQSSPSQPAPAQRPLAE